MTVDLFAWEQAIREAPLSPRAKLLALLLRTYLNKKTAEWSVGIPRLAHEMGYTDGETVKRARRELVEAGFLVVLGYTGHANLYRARLPGSPESPGGLTEEPPPGSPESPLPLEITPPSTSLVIPTLEVGDDPPSADLEATRADVARRVEERGWQLGIVLEAALGREAALDDLDTDDLAVVAAFLGDEDGEEAAA